MNPTVEAAWIAAGIGSLGIVSTAVVAVIGARNTRRVNRQTIQAATDNTIARRMRPVTTNSGSNSEPHTTS